MKRAWLTIVSAAALAWGAIPAAAQMVVAAKSGVVNYTEGQVVLNDRAVESSITKYPEMKENTVLRTDAGRVEVLLTPGMILRMGENTTLKMITSRLVDTRVELQSGSAVLEAVQTAKDNNVTVVVKNGAVAIAKAGVYRFDAEPAQVRIFRGEAAVEINGQTTSVGTGRMAMLDGSNVAVEKFNTEETDALDHWSKQRGQLLAMANPSTAKSLLGSAYASGFNGMGGVGAMGCNPYWGYNTWYAMYTYVPCSGSFMSPYGFGYWSPKTVNGFYSNLPVNSGRSGSSAGSYSVAGARSSNYSPGVSAHAASMGGMGSGRQGPSMGSGGGSPAGGGGASSAAGHATGGGGGGGGNSSGSHGK